MGNSRILLLSAAGVDAKCIVYFTMIIESTQRDSEWLEDAWESPLLVATSSTDSTPS